MTRVIAQEKLEQLHSKTVISFVKTGTETWPAWNRFLHIEGKPAYEIGNICNTCAFYFERMEGASLSTEVQTAIQQLNLGFRRLNAAALASMAALVPDGSYRVLVLEVYPKLVELGGPLDYFAHDQVELWGMDGFSGLPHYPKIQYYRGTDAPMADERKVYEFLIPLFPQSWLDPACIAHYQRELEQGATPTAISLTVLDIKAPAWIDPDESTPEFTEHWCLAHYLLDGHHKMYAASLLGKSIHLLAFVALDESILNSEADIDTLLQVI